MGLKPTTGPSSNDRSRSTQRDVRAGLTVVHPTNNALLELEPRRAQTVDEIRQVVIYSISVDRRPDEPGKVIAREVHIMIGDIDEPIHVRIALTNRAEEDSDGQIGSDAPKVVVHEPEQTAVALLT